MPTLPAAARGPSSPSTVAACRRSCSRPNCSATPPAPSPAPGATAAPLFPLGYGLDGRERGTLRKLDETPPPERCGALPPDAHEDLAVFQQVVAPGLRMVMGSPADWRVPVGDDLNAAKSTSDGHLRLETSQVNLQQDARKLAFADVAQFAIDTPKALDLAGYRKADAAVAFDVMVVQPPAGDVHVRVDCGFPCSGEMEIAPVLKALPVNTRATLRIPLQCFVDAGLDLATVDTLFALDTEKPVVLSVANVRWEVGGAKATGVLPCTPARRE